MISKSYVTISLTRDEYIKLLVDAGGLQYDADHPLFWILSTLQRHADDIDRADIAAETRRRHNIMHLGSLKPGEAA